MLACSGGVQARGRVLPAALGPVLQWLGGPGRLVRALRCWRSGSAGGPGPESAPVLRCVLLLLAALAAPCAPLPPSLDPAGGPAVDHQRSGPREAGPPPEEEERPHGVGFSQRRRGFVFKISQSGELGGDAT